MAVTDISAYLQRVAENIEGAKAYEMRDAAGRGSRAFDGSRHLEDGRTCGATIRAEYLRADRVLTRAGYSDALFTGVWTTIRF